MRFPCLEGEGRAPSGARGGVNLLASRFTPSRLRFACAQRNRPPLQGEVKSARGDSNQKEAREWNRRALISVRRRDVSDGVINSRRAIDLLAVYRGEIGQAVGAGERGA
jgi:hypothetical protein